MMIVFHQIMHGLFCSYEQFLLACVLQRRGKKNIRLRNRRKEFRINLLPLLQGVSDFRFWKSLLPPLSDEKVGLPLPSLGFHGP